jgi:hypothetical protein
MPTASLSEEHVIKTGTVLVLGAGASKPYGFPTGGELLQAFCSGISSAGYDILRDACEHWGTDPRLVDTLRRELPRSNAMSIDAFLERRPKLLAIGKLAIAYILIGSEREDRLSKPPNGESHWYKYLLSKLTSEPGLERFKDNKLSIITFNYDRSIEHFLFTSLQSMYDASDQQCREAVEAIPIIHVHGQLGRLPWQAGKTEDTRPYEPPPQDLNGTVVHTVRAARGIRVVSESEGTSEEFDRARRYLCDAKKIVFLGFAYHEQNLRRLGLSEREGPNGNGSCLGFGELERRSITQKWRIGLFPEHNEILGFLKNHVCLD